METAIKKSLEVLRNGGIILYPTDTVWGIGCDATREDAVEKIYRLKQRSEKKSMLVLLDTAGRLPQYVQEVPDIAFNLIEQSVSPLTIIYPGAKNLAANLVAEDQSIGIRITSDEFCNQLIARFGKPIVSTSANISSQPAPAIYDEISEEILLGVDYAAEWRQDDITRSKPSGIIKLGVNGEVIVIRE